MPSVRLFDREYRSGGLPDVCIHCGDKAEHCITQNFSWVPPWVRSFYFMGGLIGAIVAAANTKRCSVDIPLCENHRSHKLRMTLLTVGILLGGLALVLGSFVIGGILSEHKSGLGPVAFIFAFVMLIAMIVALVIVGQRQLRTTEITDRSITLANVDAAFVSAVEDFREEDNRPFRVDRDAEARWGDRDGGRDRSRDRDRDRDRDDRGRGRNEGRDRYQNPTDRKRDDFDFGDR